jgi:lipopolysaccharide transport system ATP-binding protein
MDPIISVEGLGKRYRIGLYEKEAQSLREAAKSLLASPFKYLRRMTRPPTEEEILWALRDVSFQVRPGEVVGIIGRNGAGKSTMLKILSRITAPTEGRIVLEGRVGSLLEVGTGFHPELTGRENTYLNGSILGMRKAEIDRKFDEIVAFADIEKFVDTPVKRYSSGMYVRLAFAVAAHLEPEILVVDEVLAVGDVAFQKKCLGKMESISERDGRTILFVSHNMQALRTLCPRSILLHEGQLVADGPTGEVQVAYLEKMRHFELGPDTLVHDETHRRGTGAVRFEEIRTVDETGAPCSEFMMGNTIRFVLNYQVIRPIDELCASVVIRASSREKVTSVFFPVETQKLNVGDRGQVVIELPNAQLRPGEYPLYFWLGNRVLQAYDVVDDMTLPLIVSTDKTPEELGFNPALAPGMVNVPARLVSAN